MLNEAERLNSIERKLDTLLILIEGKHGTEGLVKQIYKNRDDISALRKNILFAAGAASVVMPFITILIKNILA